MISLGLVYVYSGAPFGPIKQLQESYLTPRILHGKLLEFGSTHFPFAVSQPEIINNHKFLTSKYRFFNIPSYTISFVFVCKLKFWRTTCSVTSNPFMTDHSIGSIFIRYKQYLVYAMQFSVIFDDWNRTIHR